MRRDEVDYALVRCPSCGELAKIERLPKGLRLSCLHCGYSVTDAHRTVLALDDYNLGRLPFGAELWLRADCCGGHRLWAVNEAHLDYLAAYVGESQRSRAFPSQPGNRQLAWKLPTWMKEAKHRDEVLRTIGRLRQTI